MPRKARTATGPRIAPPRPRWSYVDDWHAAAGALGIEPFEWQATAAEYVMAVDDAGRWLYPETAIVVARQNGKTELLRPLIVDALDHGLRILHTAQNRDLPRETYLSIVGYYEDERADDVLEARRANGQERLRIHGGGMYAIVAPQRGARGRPGIDLVIIDEVREFEDFDLIGAIQPTTTAVDNPRTVYLSNAGHDASVVLNDLRRRADVDPSLCYLEWSAPPELAADDRIGWRQANPSPLVTDEKLERFYASLPRAIFETEHLCRWVRSMLPSLVNVSSWERLETPLEAMAQPSLGIALDGPLGRASAVLAWPQSDGTLAVTMAAEVHGDPLDVSAFGKALGELATKAKVAATAYDPATDADLARHCPNPKPLGPREFAQASERFVRSIDGARIRHADAAPIGGDLPATARSTGSHGVFIASKAQEDRAITASLAAIRAVWLAAAPKQPKPRVYGRR